MRLLVALLKTYLPLVPSQNTTSTQDMISFQACPPSPNKQQPSHDCLYQHHRQSMIATRTYCFRISSVEKLQGSLSIVCDYSGHTHINVNTRGDLKWLGHSGASHSVTAPTSCLPWNDASHLADSGPKLSYWQVPTWAGLTFTLSYASQHGTSYK